MSQEPRRPGAVLIVCHPSRTHAAGELIEHLGFYYWDITADPGFPSWAAVLWFGPRPQLWRLPPPIPHQRRAEHDRLRTDPTPGVIAHAVGPQ